MASPSVVSNSCSHDEATSIVSDKEGLAKESFQLICDAPLGDLLLRSQEKYGPITKIWLSHHIAKEYHVRILSVWCCMIYISI